jgi:hypothetical protein
MLIIFGSRKGAKMSLEINHTELFSMLSEGVIGIEAKIVHPCIDRKEIKRIRVVIMKGEGGVLELPYEDFLHLKGALVEFSLQLDDFCKERGF